jgi:uncharacterized membrane protein (UPF0127 family)
MKRRSLILLLGILLCAAVLVVGSFLFFKEAHAPMLSVHPENFTDESFYSVTLGGHEYCAEAAVSPEKKERGLAKYTPKQFGNRDAMLFVFSDPRYLVFWMKNMQFPIDIIWLRDNAVLGVERHVQNPHGAVDDSKLARYTSEASANRVLEVLSGNADTVFPGDTLTFGPPCEKTPS